MYPASAEATAKSVETSAVEDPFEYRRDFPFVAETPVRLAHSVLPRATCAQIIAEAEARDEWDSRFPDKSSDEVHLTDLPRAHAAFSAAR